MIRADERAEPRLMQRGELRRQADQRIDEENLLEFLRPVAAGHQQMPDLMLRIEQHHADGIERIGFAQAVDHGVQQLRQAIGAQQLNSRACVRFRMVSLLAASAVNSASRLLSASIS